MKPLIVILLLAVSAEAQTLADAARKERARQAKVRSVHVYSNAAPVGVTVAATAGTSGTSTATPAAASTAARPPAPPMPPPVDPMKKWNDDMDKARAKVRQLQDQETTLQLQLNQLTAQLTAPISDQFTKNQVQARMGETQNQLNATRAELEQSKKALEALTLQGPPKK